VWVNGETRLNTVIVPADGSAQTTITVDSMEVTPEHVDELRQRYRKALGQATCATLSGSLPKGSPLTLYGELIEEAHRQHVPVILDASGAVLKNGFTACPTAVKPNREELEQLCGQACPTLEQVYAAARELYQKSGTLMVVTLGAEGALAVLPDRAYYIPALPVKISSPAGAGDAVVAGLAAGLGRKDSLEDCLRLAFAAAGAAVMMPGTADIRKADVEALLPLVELKLWE
jgi:1-phosphofructokinase family hexose kinase